VAALEQAATAPATETPDMSTSSEHSHTMTRINAFLDKYVPHEAAVSQPKQQPPMPTGTAPGKGAGASPLV
jgi:hypothetical protein